MRPPSIGERPEIRAIVSAAMARDYRLAHAMPLGKEVISVYELKTVRNAPPGHFPEGR